MDKIRIKALFFVSCQRGLWIYDLISIRLNSGQVYDLRMRLCRLKSISHKTKSVNSGARISMPEERVWKSECDVSEASRLQPRAGSPRHNYKYISYLLRFIVAAAALYLAFRGENFIEVVDVLFGLNLWIFAAAIGFYVIGQLIFVARWSLLLKVQSISIGFWPAVRLHFLGLFYNNCLPGAIGGDLPRAWYVTKHTDKKLEAALSVFVDRIIGLIGMIIMAFGCYWFIPEESREGGFNFTFEVNLFRRLAEYKSIFIWLGAGFVVVIVLLVSNFRGRMCFKRGFDVIGRHRS